MLVDNVTITVKAGNGGNGSASLRRNAQTAKGGPDGGNGGNGGDVYIQGNKNLNDLREFQYKKKFTADNGTPGGRNNLYGRNANALTIFLPLGTMVTDEKGYAFEVIDETRHLIARGGKGGRGNNEFKSATNQTPLYAEKGEAGEEKTLHLELRLIADIGLIGLPNAGKSSLLSVLTHAHPKVGNYPFTTLEPSLGMLDAITLADIPGLIEGASKGKGLGIKFLKHIEKTKLLLHCIDSTEEDPLKAHSTVRKEFEEYSEKLIQKPEIILFTKIDLVNLEDLKKKIKLFPGKKILTTSVYDEESLEKVKKILISAINSNSREQTAHSE